MTQNKRNTEEQKKRTDLTIIRRLVGYALKSKKLFFAALGFSLISSTVTPVRPWVIQFIFDTFITKTSFSEESFSFRFKEWVEKMGGFFEVNALSFAVIFLFVWLLSEFFFIYFQARSMGYVGQSVMKNIRTETFGKVVRFKNAYFDNNPLGKLITRTVSDIETVSEVFASGFLSILADVLKIFFVLFIMIRLDGSLTLISLATVPLLIVATNYFRKGIKRTFKRVRDDVSSLNTYVQEHISGIEVVKTFTKEKNVFNAFEKLNRNHRNSNIRQVWYYSVYFPVVEIITATSMGLMIWYGSHQVLTLETTPGTLIAFILYINMLFRPLRQIADSFNTLQLGLVSANRVFNILDEKEMEIENVGKKEFKTLDNHKISFENVWFSYDGKKNVFEDISFSILDGETTAIIGETGAGKSTIVNLVSRFHDIDKGNIIIGDTPLKEIELNSLRGGVSLILQDVFLFSGTIRDNILLNNHTVSDESIYEAIETLGLTSFIKRFSKGVYQEVGERGEFLSIGERQLVSFVRAFVNRKEILILDEATSSIDPEFEKLIQVATEAVTKKQTSIVIAHRLTTIRNAERIIVLDKGKVLERGTHIELIKKEGLYFQYYKTQFEAQKNVYRNN